MLLVFTLITTTSNILMHILHVHLQHLPIATTTTTIITITTQRFEPIETL